MEISLNSHRKQEQETDLLQEYSVPLQRTGGFPSILMLMRNKLEIKIVNRISDDPLIRDTKL